jgi:extracellular elastinolytic metalloproteinase
LVKSAAKAAFGFGGEEQGEVSDEVIGARHQLRKADHHYTALCSTPLSGDEILTPIQALAHVLPKLQAGDDLVPISVDDLDSHPEHTFAPKNAPNEPPAEMITGKGLDVSGVVNPVPARLMYTQIDAGVPRMVWKFEIEMKENWYETYVDIYSGEIVRIVDWANDISWATPEGASRDAFKGGKQKPLPSPHKGYKPYSYQVFPWGEFILLSSTHRTDVRCQRPYRRKPLNRDQTMGHYGFSSRMARDSYFCQPMAQSQRIQLHQERHHLLHHCW